MCPKCLKAVPAKIIIKDNSIFILKYCREHGQQMELLEEVADYHLKKRHVAGILALLKSSAAFGFCGAAKLYTCLNNTEGECCRTGKKIKHIKDCR